MNVDFNSNYINNGCEMFKDIPKMKNGEDIPKIKYNMHHNRSNSNLSESSDEDNVFM